MNNNVNEENGSTLRELLHVLKRNVIFLLVIVLLCTAGGFLYANMQKPRYTATEIVFFKAQNLEEDKTTNNINVMRAYIDTVVDFCDEGVVIDRANFYYIQFKNELKDNNVQINSMKDLTDALEQFAKEVETKHPYLVGEVKGSNLNAKDITLYTQKLDSTTTQKPFTFQVRYTDDYSGEAVCKVKLLILAFRLECIEKGLDAEMKYFSGVNVEIIDEGLQGVSTNLTKNKTIILFFLLGLILGLVIIYFKNFLDNTIKTKEELEHISGLSVLSVIEEQEGEKR